MQAQTKVTEIIQRITGKPTPADPAESLFDSGVLDSFALTDVIAAVEKEFAISVPDSDLHPRKFASVSRIVQYIQSRS